MRVYSESCARQDCFYNERREECYSTHRGLIKIPSWANKRYRITLLRGFKAKRDLSHTFWKLSLHHGKASLICEFSTWKCLGNKTLYLFSQFSLNLSKQRNNKLMYYRQNILGPFFNINNVQKTKNNFQTCLLEQQGIRLNKRINHVYDAA